MFEWLKNLFGSGQESETREVDRAFEQAGDNVVINEEHEDAKRLEKPGNTLVEKPETPNKEPKFEKAQTMSGGRDKLQYLQGILQASQKGGMGNNGNSEKFTAVTQALDEINSHMNSDRFSDKAENNFQIMGPMVERYNSLIAACSDYLSRSSFTSAGKHRKAIVSQVLSLATQDISGINAAMDQIGRADPASMASTSWNDILNKARAVAVEVDFSTVKVMGGAVNKVYQLSGENSSQKEKDGTYKQLEDTKFFKPMMTFDANKTDKQQALELFVQKEKVTKKEYDYLAGLNANWREVSTDKLPEDPRLCEFALQLKALEYSMMAISTSFVKSSAANNSLGVFNVTNRNVATSRMADLLGVSNVVVRSELAEITDKTTGEKKQGILMDSAEGVSGRELQVKHRKTVAKKNWDMAETDYTDTSKNLMSPTFVKQMMQLGILDYICGQVDRHSDNFKVQLDEDGRAISLQGFDNDGSFGLHTGFSNGKHANQVYDLEGNLLHPIDKALADRIQSVSSSAIKYALRGLIADDCIDACITRLNNVKQAIQKAPEDMIIANDAGWGAETQQKMFDIDRQRVSTAFLDEQMKKFAYKDNFNRMLSEIGYVAKDLFKKKYGDRKMESLSKDEDKEFKAELEALSDHEVAFHNKNLSTIGMFAFDANR